MDKNSLILEIKNDLNSIKKQIDVALAKLAVLESMVELDNKLGVNNGELGVRSEELGVKDGELGVGSEELGVKETKPEPVVEPELIKESELEQEIEQKFEEEFEEKFEQESEKEEVAEKPTPHSSLLTPNCKTQEFRNLMSIIGLNDRFRFRHDLFSDDNDLFRETIDILNTLEDFEKAVDFLEEKFNWDPEDATVVYFYDIIKPKF